jgi:hypothetical protein
MANDVNSEKIHCSNIWVLIVLFGFWKDKHPRWSMEGLAHGAGRSGNTSMITQHLGESIHISVWLTMS